MNLQPPRYEIAAYRIYTLFFSAPFYTTSDWTTGVRREYGLKLDDHGTFEFDEEKYYLIEVGSFKLRHGTTLSLNLLQLICKGMPCFI